MFSKISRYRKLPDEVTVDADGRTTESKSLRLTPEVSGAFIHTVEEFDRLDHLAFKYYRQPRKWWRICDANPEFFSPQALLGKEPVVTERFPLPAATGGAEPPWHQLLPQLRAIAGVEDVQLQARETLVAQNQTISGQTVTVFVPLYERAIVIRYNRLNVSGSGLAGVITTAGVNAGPSAVIGRVGKATVIPPDVVT